MDEFTTRVLLALVEGYQARSGLKDRNRALTEYEIARRAGYIEFSYVEFSTTMERDQVRGALDELAGEGWVSQWQSGGRYDSFVPTEMGIRRASTLGVTGGLPPTAEAAAGGTASPALAAVAPAHAPKASLPPLEPAAALTRLVQQLDEALRLLRSIDAKLGRDR